MTLRVPTVVALVACCMPARFDLPAQRVPVVAVEPSGAGTKPPDPAQGVVYSCPMDPDVRGYTAGVCRRCGMRLVAGVPAPVEFHVDLQMFPSSPAPNRPAVIQFLVHDPWKDRAVRTFNVVHEKLFHAFAVSEDLEFFTHGHPTFVADGVFQFPIEFPKPGMYRVLGDFYPAGATPQLSSQTVIVAGDPPAPKVLERDYAAKAADNVRLSLRTIPDDPVAGNRTQLRFEVTAPKGLQRYLGAWAHMLAASNDLIDMMHEHPFSADGGPQIEFEMVFPRPGVYRVWVQVQSDGLVNTVHFDVPVKPNS